ncbi:MAG: response regulator transcription factor [Chloroflexota bacterium]
MVEDNPEIIEIVAQTMKIKWPEVNLLSTFLGERGVELVKKEAPDIVILDLGLPDIDGFQVLRQIRAFSDVLVVILTVRGEEEDKIRGLQEGADDYMVKPFSPGELVARLQSLLRRSQITETKATVAEQPPAACKLTIDANSQTVSLEGKLLKLSPREYELLCLLSAHEGKVVSNQELMEKVFPEQKGDIRFLWIYMNKLMEALGDNPDEPTIIINDGGKGYKFAGLK